MDITPSPFTISSLSSSPNKCTHKAPKIKTEDYHDRVVKKRRTVNKTKATKPSSTKKSQSTIVNFLSPNNKVPSLKEEDYFIVPPNIDGFNLFSLRRHIHSIKTKPNIVALIKKCVIHNNINPSTQKSSPTKRYSQRSLITNKIVNTNQKKNDFVYLDSRLNRCYLEDFIALPCGTHICILVPRKEVVSTKKSIKCVDEKLISIINTTVPPLTQLGGTKDIYYIINATISTTPNRDASITGIDRASMKAGLHGSQKFGSLIKVEGCGITPLIKWRDVLNGCKDGIQV